MIIWIFRESITLNERNSEMPQIQGIKGEAVSLRAGLRIFNNPPGRKAEKIYGVTNLRIVYVLRFGAFKSLGL